MAKGGGAQQNKGGGKGGGGGKKTARSQSYNYLRQFGYPSPRELRREAQGLASAAVPTVRQVSTPFNQQMRSTRDYLAAVQSALAQTSQGVNQGYDASLAQSQGVDAAAQQRLAGLGLGADSAGVQAATGAAGDSQTQALIANAAAAKHAAAQMPTIAAGAASQNQQVLQGKLLDALANRRDQLSQAFFQALQTAQQQGMQTAQFNQGQYQFTQNMALQQAQMAQQNAQFNASQAQSAAEAAASRRQSANQFHQQMLAQGFDTRTGTFTATPQGQNLTAALAQKYGTSIGVISTMQQHATNEVTTAIGEGASWRTALARAEGAGVLPEVAHAAVLSVYGNPQRAPAAKPFVDTGSGGSGVAFTPPAGWKPQKVVSYLKSKNVPQNSINGYMQTVYNAYYHNYRAYQDAVAGFKYGPYARSLQRAYDSVLHYRADNTEH